MTTFTLNDLMYAHIVLLAAERNARVARLRDDIVVYGEARRMCTATGERAGNADIRSLYLEVIVGVGTELWPVTELMAQADLGEFAHSAQPGTDTTNWK